eukprot:12629626-Alexandrium_andersonii.AAC.1
MARTVPRVRAASRHRPDPAGNLGGCCWVAGEGLGAEAHALHLEPWVLQGELVPEQGRRRENRLATDRR